MTYQTVPVSLVKPVHDHFATQRLLTEGSLSEYSKSSDRFLDGFQTKCVTLQQQRRMLLLARAQQLVLRCSTCITPQAAACGHELENETAATEQPLCSSPGTGAAASGSCLAGIRLQEGSVSPRDTKATSMDRQSCSY